MSYLVLARKYRPETFVDLVGQDPVSKTLRNSIQKGRIAHAFLFAGPRGVGKTSMARILAKALNCERGPTAEPCLTCAQCRAVASGSAVDVVEIDAASNRGIDNIRSLRENVRYTPAGSRFKIYIIDEVHMLTAESFNALLKTLEEPPPHVKFIFATTEPQKLPETVRSRCQSYEFRRISTADIAARLELIMKSEGLSFEPGVLHRIAEYARGGMRDAQSLLDQIIAYGGGSATFEGMSELTGSLSPAALLDLADAILAEDPRAVLHLVDGFFSGGTRAEDLFRELISHWRRLMYILAGGAGRDQILAGADQERLKAQAEKTGLDQVLIMLQIAMHALRQGRFFDDERILAEITLLKMSRAGTTMDLADALAHLKTAGANAPPPARARRGAPNRAGAGDWSEPGIVSEGRAGPGSSAGIADAGGQARRSERTPAQLPPAGEGAGGAPGARASDLGALYAAVLAEVAKTSKTSAISLEDYRPLRLHGDTIVLAPIKGLQKKLLTPADTRVAGLLRDASQRVAGRVFMFKVEGGEPAPSGRGIPPIVEKTMQMFQGDIV